MWYRIWQFFYFSWLEYEYGKYDLENDWRIDFELFKKKYGALAECPSYVPKVLGKLNTSWSGVDRFVFIFTTFKNLFGFKDDFKNDLHHKSLEENNYIGFSLFEAENQNLSPRKCIERESSTSPLVTPWFLKLKFPLAQVSKLNKKNNYDLHHAVSIGDLKAVEFLLNTSDLEDLLSRIDKLGRTPFDLAAIQGKFKIADLIFDKIKDKNKAHKDALLHSSKFWSGNVNAVNYLLQKDIKVVKNDYFDNKGQKKTGIISKSSFNGQHTTTFAQMHPLGFGEFLHPLTLYSKAHLHICIRLKHNNQGHHLYQNQRMRLGYLFLCRSAQILLLFQ